MVITTACVTRHSMLTYLFSAPQQRRLNVVYNAGVEQVTVDKG